MVLKSKGCGNERDVFLCRSYQIMSMGRLIVPEGLIREIPKNGGDDGVRTHDLRLAKPALSQLSYVPVSRDKNNNRPSGDSANAGATIVRKVVGLTRFELVTSRLSAGRSNQLSYRPNARRYITVLAPVGQRLFTFSFGLLSRSCQPAPFG